jgi:hypothetical protein
VVRISSCLIGSRAHTRARASTTSSRARALASTLVLSLCSAACVTSSGRLEGNRFQHADYPYALFYAPYGRRETPLGPHYRLENFRSPDGQHVHPRSGTGYSITRTYPDTSPPLAQREPFYDLLLSRDQPEAAFWLRSVPLRPEQAGLGLDQLADRYLGNVANAGRVAVTFGVEGDARSAHPAQLRVLNKRSCELSKRAALRLDFEVDVSGSGPEQAAQSAASARAAAGPRWKQGSVVLVQSGYLARGKYPVLVLAGRSSAPADAAALEPDFDQMLSRLVLGDKGQGLSMKGGHSCGLEGLPPGSAAGPAQGASEGSGGERAPTPELEVPIIQDQAPGAPGTP